MPATLTKEERINGKKDIAALLSKGKWCQAGVLKACIAPNGEGFSRIMVSVPKRLFKRAVKRNLLKRRIREAYRLQKDLLGGGIASEAGSTAFGFDILLQYNAADVSDFEAIKADVKTILEKIAK